jgi:hypothetical protein
MVNKWNLNKITVYRNYLFGLECNNYCVRYSRVGGRLFHGKCRALPVAGSENLFVRYHDAENPIHLLILSRKDSLNIVW